MPQYDLQIAEFLWSIDKFKKCQSTLQKHLTMKYQSHNLLWITYNQQAKI